ncbi:FK506-binding protein [Lacunisphaera limnophila]|uniref:Peptidyl-prolyl cis-trans isomerase n=1 Tax=Lacunisphaera limnophila TaxID=1838286 RepID=A0A1D8AU15_9BACT|nr:FKBP-type peptidyl-prolyl cis-trans isomerase [Lacunisphaera limnophila]AOS44388.1 FK506-binding protein [Lacunisphaera limnophila]
MRTYGILLVLGLFLMFIAWQARTGIFRRHSDTDLPANKYTRQMMENPQLSEADAAVLRTDYNTAHTSPSGLRYLVRAPGAGSPPSLGAEVVAHYEGYLLDGRKFDSSVDRGQPFVFRVGTGAVIKGWDEAFLTMKKGEKRTLLIPWWLGYGEQGRGMIPPRGTLRFEVELLDIH